jgi:hypothetical protein
VVGAQAFQELLGCFEKVLAAVVESVRSPRRIIAPPDTNLTLQNQVVAEGRFFLQNASEDFFSPSPSVNVGVVVEIGAEFEAGVEELPGLLLVFLGEYGVVGPTPSQAHAT